MIWWNILDVEQVIGEINKLHGSRYLILLGANGKINLTLILTLKTFLYICIFNLSENYCNYK